MSRTVNVWWAGSVLAGGVLWAAVAIDSRSVPAFAQLSSPGTRAGQGADADAADAAPPVVIRREPLRLLDPRGYQVPLQLVPHRTIELAAPADGTIRTSPLKPGQRVEVQAEAARLDNTEQQFELERVRANHRAAQIELKIATAKNDPDLTELAEARLQATKAELDLATHRHERTTVRVPFAGEVFRVLVMPGQMVRRGEPLVVIADTSKLIAEIPVDRNAVEVGGSIEVRIEGRTVPGKVEQVLPLEPRFEPLRELVESAATAVVAFDSPGGQLKAGQTVYSPIIPRRPVTEVPSATVGNLVDGGRRVQVVRSGVVRDVPVELLGQVGAERIFVTGPFADEDELIVSSSQDLPDGTRVRLRGAGEGSEDERPEASPRRPRPAATDAPF